MHYSMFAASLLCLFLSSSPFCLILFQTLCFSLYMWIRTSSKEFYGRAQALDVTAFDSKTLFSPLSIIFVPPRSAYFKGGHNKFIDPDSFHLSFSTSRTHHCVNRLCHATAFAEVIHTVQRLQKVFGVFFVAFLLIFAIFDKFVSESLQISACL